MIKFESLNGETLSQVKGGKVIVKLPTTQLTDHACGRHGCGGSSGLLVTEL